MKPMLGGLREKKNEEVKKAFFRAAVDLFREQGFEKTSVDEIAERAGFSRATFFNHFGTKQGVLRYYGQHLRSRVEQLLDETERAASPLELIREILFLMARDAEAHQEDLKLVCLYSLQDLEYSKGPTPARWRILDILTDLVGQAQREKQVRQDIPAREQAFHILSLYQSAVLAIVMGFATTEPMLQSVWQFILGGTRGGDPMAE